MTHIGYSTTGFRDRSVEAALEAIAAAGFRHVEILGQAPHVERPLTGEALSAFRRRLVAAGLEADSVHAPFGRRVLGVPDEGWRQENVAIFSAYARFTASIGAGGMVIHPVPNPSLVADPTAPELVTQLEGAIRRSLDELLPVAQDAGISLLLENLPYRPNYPFIGMQQLRPLVDSYPDEHVGLVIDTGHAWSMGRDPAAEILVAGPRLGGTHLQDVDFDHPEDNHWLPTHGGLDWDSIRHALNEIRYTGTWMFEVIRPKGGEGPDELARLTFQIAQQWGLVDASCP